VSLSIYNSFILIGFASTAGGQRNRNAAPFVSFKKYATHFFNGACSATETKEAANPVTGIN
jgi:hypothetical protein